MMEDDEEVDILVDDRLMSMFMRLQEAEGDEYYHLIHEIMVWLTYHVASLHKCLELHGVSRNQVIDFLENQKSNRVLH